MITPDQPVPPAKRPDPARSGGGPRHAPRVPFALLVGGLAVGGLCALLALNTASAANELSRHDLAVADAGIAAQVQQLQNEVAASAAPNNLASAAAALGMVPAGNPAFIQVGADGRVRILGSASPATALPMPPPVRPVAPPPTSSHAATPSPRNGASTGRGKAGPQASRTASGKPSSAKPSSAKPSSGQSSSPAAITLGGGAR